MTHPVKFFRKASDINKQQSEQSTCLNRHLVNSELVYGLSKNPVKFEIDFFVDKFFGKDRAALAYA